MDLESGMEAKKVKTEKAGAPASNLSKSKSKSMMSIAQTGEFQVAILLFFGNVLIYWSGFFQFSLITYWS